ncbi:hypothetical protein OV208_11555 [Corallococcus sp. bb12-1]|uniref:hypothetical protein n=1 Tax=Corallococcus sp. bb12-1 TaxID=2996784 RepID=UPI00227226CD|nr:hypothetical protein [Corallococcus sp. bb12-1]MCY1041951.1 hypothetical protein [Corallococcus sp. bb12-1]
MRQDIETNLEFRKALMEDLSGHSHHIINAFSNSFLNTFYWPMLYTCLLGIAVILKPRGATEPGLRRFTPPILTGTGLYLLLELPSLARAFLPEGEERSIYVFTQSDIDLPSFAYQEFEILGLMILLATIWDNGGPIFMPFEVSFPLRFRIRARSS